MSHLHFTRTHITHRIGWGLLLLLLSVLLVNSTAAQPIPLPPSTGAAFVNPEESTGDGKTASITPHIPNPFFTPTGGGVPLNDNFANATVISSLPFTQIVSGIESATLEPNELFGFCSGRSKSVWFQFTLAADAVIDISLNGSTYDTGIVLYTNPSDTTLSYVACNDDFNGLQSAIYHQSLKAGIYYIQALAYLDVGPIYPSALKLDVRLSGQALPEHFQLEAPKSDLTVPVVPAVFRWDEAAPALSYAFTVERIEGSPLEAVFSLPNLTPAADLDGLTCENDGCVLNLPAENQALITDQATYIWYVTATNINGTIFSYGVADSPAYRFTYNSGVLPTSFDPTYPLNNRTRSIVPTRLIWTAALGASFYSVKVDRIAPFIDLDMLPDVGDLTPDADLDQLYCDDLICTLNLTVNQMLLLTDNAVYQWQVGAVNLNGKQVASLQSFTLDSTPAPREFVVKTPLSSSVYPSSASAFLVFSFDHPTGAQSYDFTLYRLGDPIVDIITLHNLTPASDGADNLSCTTATEDTNGTCRLVLSPFESAFVADGIYGWTLIAENGYGVRLPTTDPLLMTFTVDSLFMFNALTPTDGATFASPSDVLSFSWEESGNGLVINSYNVALSGLYGGYHELLSMTPAADGDRLTCLGGLCNLTVSGVELGLSRNQYKLTLNAKMTIGDQVWKIPASTNGTHDFTIGDLPPSQELVVNGGFEGDTSIWVAKNLNGAKQKCNQNGKVFAYGGNCAWQVKGLGNPGKLEQLLPVTNLMVGDTLRVSGYVDAKNNDNNAQLRLRVIYSDTVLEDGKIVLKFPAGTYGYTYVYQDLVLTGVPSKIKLQIRNAGTTGRVRLDLVSVMVDLAARRTINHDLVIPLPDSDQAAVGRGTNTQSSMGSGQ